MALQYVKPGSAAGATNPLNERRLSFQDAQSLGYILPLDATTLKYQDAYNAKLATAQSGDLQPESFYQDLFDTGLAVANKLYAGGQVNSDYASAVTAVNMAPQLIELRTKAIKEETGREAGRSQAALKRFSRATGGLLAGAASPSLDGGKGLPELGKGSTMLSTASSKIGTKAKI